MSELPSEAQRRLLDSASKRSSAACVAEAIESLGVAVPVAFRSFYERYQGPFSSERTGFGLLDLCEHVPNVVQLTEACRREHGWPLELVVLTELLGNSVLVLDASHDQVFNVDFEGGDQLLLSRKLPPSWSSFNEFISYYFG